MTWLTKWQALSARIEGLIQAGELLSRTSRGNDVYSVTGRSIMPELAAIRGEILRFGMAHETELPNDARDALERFKENPAVRASTNEFSGLSLIVPVAVFRSEFNYLIHSWESEARTLTELAFEHLRRLIFVDQHHRDNWNAAFSHETRCEQLGAVHLLSHGIWAFKISNRGSTDLVFGEPMEQHAVQVRRTARALVATEWKRVKNADECAAKASEAQKQLRAYERGVLADLTLTSTRYVVLVSSKTLPAVKDAVVEEITYRHILIATDPDSPSGEARRAGTA
jgi:hypothetical protein